MHGDRQGMSGAHHTNQIRLGCGSENALASRTCRHCSAPEEGPSRPCFGTAFQVSSSSSAQQSIAQITLSERDARARHVLCTSGAWAVCYEAYNHTGARLQEPVQKQSAACNRVHRIVKERCFHYLELFLRVTKLGTCITGARCNSDELGGRYLLRGR